MRKKQLIEEDSDPFNGEDSVDLSSIDSEQEARDREAFLIMKEIRQNIMRDGPLAS